MLPGRLLLFLALVASARANLLVLSSFPTINNTEDLFLKIREFEKAIQSGTDTIMQNVLPVLVRANSELSISPDCSSILLKMVFAIRQQKSWPYEMLDASGKLPSGLLTGTHADFGTYDECVNINVPDEYDPDRVQFQGKYCTIEFHTLLPQKPRYYKLGVPLKIFDNFTSDNFILRHLLKISHFGYFLGIRFGICLPSVCDMEDVQKMLKIVPIGLPSSVRRCEIKEPFVYTRLQIGVISVFSLFGLLLVVGTAVEVLPGMFSKKEDSGPTKSPSFLVQAITSFSINSNVIKLMKVGPKNNLSQLHGIKFLSMTWVIMGHTYLQWNMQLIRSIQDAAITEIRSFAFQAVINALVAVDTFFFITGILVCFITVKAVDKHGTASFSIPLFIIHRIWRLLPATMGVIGIALLLPIMGTGPVWHETIDVVADNCKHNWWANLLFINNFIDPVTMCLPHTWYTACDMQHYLLALIFFLLLFRKPFLSFMYLAFLVIFSIISLAVVNLWFDLPPTIMPSSPDPEQFIDLWKIVQFKPHTHLAPYAMGLAVGYFLMKHPKFTLHPLLQLVGWVLAIALNLSILYATYLWNDKEYATKFEAAAYASLHKPGWILGVSWMVIMCATGRGGFINNILSWSAFVCVSRLTYLAYLLHCLVIWIYIGNMRGPVDGHQLVATWIIVANIIVTYSLAFVCHVLFEAPMSRLYSLVTSRFVIKKSLEKKKDVEGIGDVPDIEKNGSTVKLTAENGTVVYRL